MQLSYCVIYIQYEARWENGNYCISTESTIPTVEVSLPCTFDRFARSIDSEVQSMHGSIDIRPKPPTPKK